MNQTTKIMKTPIEVIESLGLNSTSSIRSVQDFGYTQYSIDEYNRIIVDVLGLEESLNLDNVKYARIYANYTIQETIKAFQTDSIPDMESVAHLVRTKAETFASKHPYCINKYEDDEVLQLQENGETVMVPKKKKGARRDHSERLFKEMKDTHSRKEIIEAFITQVGMTKAGATTYFYNCKTKFGFAKKEEEKQVKKQSKMERARVLYANSDDKTKPFIMNLFQTELDTSKLGSQTYYYACKKEFETAN